MMFGERKIATFPVSLWQFCGSTSSSLTSKLLNNESHEIELSDYRRLSSSGSESPTELLNGDSIKTDFISDLDLFFERSYIYHCGKGLWCIIVKWVLELLSLCFTICFSGFCLLFVDWKALMDTNCGIDAIKSGNNPCDLAQVAIRKHPLVPFTFSKGIIVGYLGIFFVFWIFCFLKFFVQLKDTLLVHRFYKNSLNMTDSEIQTTSWPEILEKLVQIQNSRQLCIVKDLSAHDVIMRIMRKQNYLIGMVNKGVLALSIPWWFPGAGPIVKSGETRERKRLILTKTLEWTLNWCIFQSMFDRNFCVRQDFINNPASLKKRLMIVGIGMLLISPFLVIFMLAYLFLRHAEHVYHHPSIASSRRWSNLSMWIFREFNEVDHLFKLRMNNGVTPAADYVKQFPSPIFSLTAKFISFISGGFAAVLIIIAFVKESLLEGHIFGRNLLWYAAVFGTLSALSRAIISDDPQVLDPKASMSLVVHHTHHMPKRWRGNEKTDLVCSEFKMMFQYTGKLMVEEMASIFLTPYLLIFVLPKNVEGIIQFISDFTTDVEGVGHVCSLSTFDFGRHGNTKYGSPYNASHNKRSSQGKMEKSFLSFQNTYPSWDPNATGKQFLSQLHNFRLQQMQCRQYRQTQDLGHEGESFNFHVTRPLTDGEILRSDHDRSSTIQQNKTQYLLDWYYTSQPFRSMDDSNELQTTQFSVTNGLIGACYNSTRTGTIQEENFDYSLNDRRNMLEASTSSRFLQSSIIKHHGPSNPSHSSNRNWWARSGLRMEGLDNSFLEPPDFSYHQNAENFSEVSSEDQGDTNYRNSSILRTTFLDIENDGGFNLPFHDIYKDKSHLQDQKQMDGG